MLARYYVYGQRMGRGRKSARKPRKGIRRLELVEKKRGGGPGSCESELAGCWSYIPGQRQYERTWNEITEGMSVPFMKRCKDGCVWVGVCNVGQQGQNGRGGASERKGQRGGRSRQPNGDAESP